VGQQYNGELSLTMIILTIVSVLFVTVTVIFSLALILPDRCRRSRGCPRAPQGSGRPVPVAFERLQDAVQRCRDSCVDDGQMLVVVGREGEISDDVVKVGSDDDSV